MREKNEFMNLSTSECSNMLNACSKWLTDDLVQIRSKSMLTVYQYQWPNCYCSYVEFVVVAVVQYISLSHSHLIYDFFFGLARAALRPRQIKFAIEISQKYTPCVLNVWLWRLRRDKIVRHWIIVNGFVDVCHCAYRYFCVAFVFVLNADATVLQTKLFIFSWGQKKENHLRWGLILLGFELFNKI